MSILYKNTTGVYIINRIKSLQFFQPRCPLHLFVGTCLFVFLLDCAIPCIITYRNLQIVQRLYTNNIDNNFIGKAEYHITTRFHFKNKGFQKFFLCVFYLDHLINLYDTKTLNLYELYIYIYIYICMYIYQI
jgi:hypothetical protein